jgi:hypothetical protein
MVYLGAAVALVGLGLLAWPVALYGAERFDLEQEAGLLVGPVGLVIIWIGAVDPDPRRTTVGGFFGNPEEAGLGPEAGGPPSSVERVPWNPNEPVDCRQCRTVITADLSRCPRCSRARPCRECGRPLGQVLERPTCPRCARAEPRCSCPRLAHPGAEVGVRASYEPGGG